MYDIKIWADGSCLRNGKDNPQAGWAAILSCNNKKKFLSGKIEAEKPTNNIAELTAVIKAVEAIKPDTECKVEILTDSKYVTDAIANKYVHNWVKNGWKTTSKAPVANKELWVSLINVCKGHAKCKFSFTHVDGHSGDVNNELCDKLARAAASK